ncbi:MAG: hypothetical protein WB501_09735 [Nitrososphaeraceae archaeon]
MLVVTKAVIKPHKAVIKPHKAVIKAYKKQMRLLINPLLSSTVIISDIKKDGIIRE